MKLTVVILTKNEEENIKDCISSVEFADEILAIDDNSSDNTPEVAKNAGARVIKRSLDKNYAKQKNFALKNAKGEWVMFLDADERVSEALKKEILDTVKKEEYSAYELRRMDYFLGKWLKYGDIGTYRNIRVMKKNSGKWKRRVHEYFETNGNIGKLHNPILHYSHSTIRKLINSNNRWSSWHAEANQEEGKRPSLIKIIVWPMVKFVDSFIIKKGFIDGLHGFVFAIFVSLHSFLAWSKLWLLQRK